MIVSFYDEFKADRRKLTWSAIESSSGPIISNNAQSSSGESVCPSEVG